MYNLIRLLIQLRLHLKPSYLIHMILRNKLASEWKPALRYIETKIIGINEIHKSIEKILKGQISGRVVIEHRKKS